MSQRMSVRAERVGDLAARLGLCAVAAVQAHKQLADFDLPWHLALGRHIAGTWALPRVDPLAFTHRPIDYMEFLSDLGLWVLYRAGGPLALQLFGALLAVAILLVYLARAPGPISLVVLAFLVVAIGNWMIVRPATVSLLLISLFLLFLEVHRQDPTSRRSRRLLAALVPLVALWVNLHGFAVLGVTLVVGYASYRSCCRLARGRAEALLPSSDGTALLPAWAVAACAVAASWLNLAGYRLWVGPLRASADFSRIAEWQKPSMSLLLDQELGVLALAVLAVIALVLGRQPNGRRLPDAFELGLWVLALALGATSFRMIPVAVVMVAPLLARRLGGLSPATPRLSFLAGLTVPLAAPLMALNTPTSFGVGFDPRHFPEPAVAWVERHDVQGRMYNFLDFGGYLSLRLFPRHLVLVDGRSGWVHEPELLARYHRSLYDPAAFAALASEHSLEWAFVRAQEDERFGLPLAASPELQLVYLDDLAAIYVRAAGPNQPLAARGYRQFRHLTRMPSVLDAALSQRVSPDDIAHDAALAVEQAPRSPRARFFAVCGAIALRDIEKYRAAHGELGKLAPGHPTLALLDAAAASVGLSVR